MLKRLLLVTAALAVAILPTASAVAQSQVQFPKPPDVRPYVEVVPQYEAQPGVFNRRQTPSDIPPLMANGHELPDIPSPNRTQLLSSNTSGACKTIYFGGTCQQAKFRSHLDVTHILYDDPIRNYGQPGQSHCHLFFGNRSTNAYSTYASLRQRAQKYANASGGGLNGTAYWMPCMLQSNAFGDGKNYAVLPESITLYYTDAPSNYQQMKLIPFGLRYVTGWNMDDGGAYVDQLIANANAASAAAGGSATRYRAGSISSAPTKTQVHVWDCHQKVWDSVNQEWDYNKVERTNSASGDSQSFVNADGSDPWNGQCTDGKLYLHMNGTNCWDGVNLWSPGGYKHLIPNIYDSTEGKSVCPENYYLLPSLELNFSFQFNSVAQRMSWRLSSDPTVGGGGTLGRWTGVRPGDTFHTDWMGAWDGQTLRDWNRHCLGAEGTEPHECGASTISLTQNMKYNQANPQGGAWLSPRYPNRPNLVATDMWLLPSVAKNGGATLTVHKH